MTQPGSTRLTVLNVAYPFAPLGDDASGGAEQVLSRIDEALVTAGHRSLVLACSGSQCSGTLLAMSPIRGLVGERQKAEAFARYREAVARVIPRFEVDVVHMHGIGFHEHLPPPGPPVLATLHLPPSWYPAEVFRPTRPSTYLCCVSASQRASCPPSAALLDDVPNGVRLQDFSANKPKASYVLALGRICPEKGFEAAIEAAKRARVTLLLAGRVFPYEEHERYFAERIAPALDDDRRFIGPVGLAEKRRWLARARCLLVPSLVPETSSLVAMEALASGTPVVAFRVGALAEIIEHGKTGFLVSDIDEMARAIGQTASLRPEDCRRAAESRFSADVMCARYIALYEALAAGPAGEDRPPSQPRAALGAQV